MKESKRQALMLLKDDELYGTARNTALGLEKRVWGDESNPGEDWDIVKKRLTEAL